MLPGRAHGRARRRPRSERDSLSLVLNLIRSGRVGTRQAIQSASGLGRAVVTDRVATLIERGLVVEGPLGASTGGRAPATVRLNGTAGAVLVASLGTTTLGVGLSDLSGNLRPSTTSRSTRRLAPSASSSASPSCSTGC